MCNLMTTVRNLLTVLTMGLTLQVFGQSVVKDTTFIFKDTVDREIQTIFIDNNKDSKAYDKISNFTFQYFDNQSYKYSIDNLEARKKTLTKATPVILWTNWVTLKQYKGKYYAYHPCDFLFHFRQSLNDSTFIDWTGEGPVANKITEQEKINTTTYEFILDGVDQDRKLTIHIIDLKRGIAVFEQTDSNTIDLFNGTDKKYYLMIAADKIKSVPIIVNHCPTQKQSELEFDKTDFKKLLTTK